jgi:hypothetical protein
VILIQILLGSTLLVITTIIHAAGMAIGMHVFTRIYQHRLGMTFIFTRSLVIGVLILIMFVTTIIESGVWAVTYTILGAIPEFEKALYFSTVTYTTLGYGDLVLEDSWRLLSSFQAANGIIMFGWTTALIIVAIRQVSQSLHRLDAKD